MSSIAQIFDGLSSTISSATGLRMCTYVPPDLNPPAMFLSLGEIERGAMGRGQMEFPIDAVLFVSKAVERIGQATTYEYASFVGEKSVWKAVDDNSTLGLDDTACAVLRYRPLGIQEIAAYGYFGGAFELIVSTSGAD